MSQANACELKAALGHVLVSPPQATGNMTMPMITINGGTLSYDVSGAGPPIVFVAGLGEHGTYWMAQVAAFSSAFQVVTFDHGGVGASEGQPPYKVEQWAADTLRLIDHLGLDRVHLVGHSTGGAIAQVLAADHSDRVASSLVLGATWARLDARLRKLFIFRKRALHEQVGFDRRSASRNTPQEIAAARIDALLAYDAGERLRSIRKPTLLIAAADDLLVPWQLNELIAEEIAHAHVKLDHGGHHFPRTQVEA
jgi:aminoacrylate hydrolase